MRDFGAIFRFDPIMSHLLQYNSPLAFADDDDTMQASFESFPSFVDASSSGAAVHRVVPESQPSVTSSGGAAVQHVSVHDMIRDAGIQLSSQPSSNSIAALYPHCARQFTEDFDSSLLVNWNFCTAGQIYDICASPHMRCGRSNSMTWLLKFAVGVLTNDLSVFCPDDSKKLKDMTAKTMKPSQSLRDAFQKCCAGVGVLDSLKQYLNKYTQNKANVIRWQAGVMPEENANLLDQLRLAAIMIDPRYVLHALLIIYVI